MKFELDMNCYLYILHRTINSGGGVYDTFGIQLNSPLHHHELAFSPNPRVHLIHKKHFLPF